LNSFQEKTRAVKAILYLIGRVEMGADAHLARGGFDLDFLVIAQPQIPTP